MGILDTISINSMQTASAAPFFDFLATGIVDIQYVIYLVALHLAYHLHLPQTIDSI